MVWLGESGRFVRHALKVLGISADRLLRRPELSARHAGTTSMRIDNNDLSGINSSATSESQKARSANEQDAVAVKQHQVGANQDEVHLSSVAGHLSDGSIATDRYDSAERSARIEHLTKLVQSGKYEPDPGTVADSMIRDMHSSTDLP